MKLEELKVDLEKGDWVYRGLCHDCGIPVESKAELREDGAIVVSGGAVYKMKMNLENKYFFKCDRCFQKDKVLHDYQACEVYSRVVGYLRPVSQYNLGKKAEFVMRKEFTNTN